MDVCFHRIYSSDGIICFSGEMIWEGCLDFCDTSGGRHGVHWWWVDWGLGGRDCGWLLDRGCSVDIVVADVTEGFRVIKGVTGGRGFIVEATV